MRDTDDPLLDGDVEPPPGAVVNDQDALSASDPHGVAALVRVPLRAPAGHPGDPGRDERVAGPARARGAGRRGARRARGRDRALVRAGRAGRRRPRRPRAVGRRRRARPRSSSPRRAHGVVAYIHGGGWMMGTVASYDTPLRALANASGATVAAVEYRLSPEHRFPAALEDSLAAIRWLAAAVRRRAAGAGRRQRGRQPRGRLRAAAARRDRPSRLQALIYPVTDAALNRPTHREFADGHGLSTAQLRRCWSYYLDGADGGQPDASPLRAGLAGAAPGVRPHRRGGHPARRGRGLRRRAARRRRAGRAGALARDDPRVLPLARGGGSRPRGGRRRGRRAARRVERQSRTRGVTLVPMGRSRPSPLSWRPRSPRRA